MRSEVKTAIENSKYFFILGTENFFYGYEPEVIEQVAYAKSLKKPFRVLLKEGIKIPDNFFNGVTDYKVAECDLSNPERCALIAKDLCRDKK